MRLAGVGVVGLLWVLGGCGLLITDRTLDADGDGFDLDVDCDDSDPGVNPGVELDGCARSGVNDDCDGRTDEDAEIIFAPDCDGDGFGAALATDDGLHNHAHCEEPEDTFWDQERVQCSGGTPSIWSSNQLDCDDEDPTSHPRALEVCDRSDNDCNGRVDDIDDVDGAGGTAWYPDQDDDGFGTDDPDAQPLYSCDAPAAHVADQSDCDDGASEVNPAAEEICGNEIDDNCDGVPAGCGASTSELASDGHSTHWMAAEPGGETGWSIAMVHPAEEGLPGVLAVGQPDVGQVHLWRQGTDPGSNELPAPDVVLDNEGVPGAGVALSAAGDFTGDGTPDLVVGSSDRSLVGVEGHCGEVWLISDLASLEATADLDEASAWHFVAEAATSGCNGGLGWAVAGAGDVDGRHGDDLLISAWGVTSDGLGGDYHMAWLVSGPADALAEGTCILSIDGADCGSTPIDTVTFQLPTESQLSKAGRDVTAIGDLDGDGRREVLVAGRSRDSVSLFASGELFAQGGLPASTTAPDPTVEFVQGTAPWQESMVADLGDVDGDGHADLAIGSPYGGVRYEAGPTGVVYLVRGHKELGGTCTFVDVTTGVLCDTGHLVPTLTGLQANDRVGFSLVSPGDFSGDELPDLVVGAPGWSHDGALTQDCPKEDDATESRGPGAILLTSQLANLGSMRIDPDVEIFGDEACAYMGVGTRSGSVAPGSGPWRMSSGSGASSTGLDLAVGEPRYASNPDNSGDLTLAEGRIHVLSLDALWQDRD